MFKDRPLKLGTFCANLSSGAAITTIDGALKADWPSTIAVARAADAMEFEAQLPVARWRGFGGPSEFNEHSFETFTWAAGVTASTGYSCIVSTSHAVRDLHIDTVLFLAVARRSPCQDPPRTVFGLLPGACSRSRGSSHGCSRRGC